MRVVGVKEARPSPWNSEGTEPDGIAHESDIAMELADVDENCFTAFDPREQFELEGFDS